MAIPIAIAGALKTALKNAIKKSVRTLGKEAIKNGSKKVTQDFVKETVKKTITDEQAILLNRLKTIPSKELYKYVANDLGIPIDGVKEIVKNFNQTEKMKNASKGKTFRDLASKKISKKFGLNKFKNIKDIYSKIRDFNEDKSEESKQQKIINKAVLLELTDIEKEIKQKAEGVQGAWNKRNRKIKIDTNIIKYFDKTKNYNEENIKWLSSIADDIMEDIEFYDEGGGALDLAIVYENDEGWLKYEKDALLNFVKQIKEMVVLALK